MCDSKQRRKIPYGKGKTRVNPGVLGWNWYRCEFSFHFTFQIFYIKLCTYLEAPPKTIKPSLCWASLISFNVCLLFFIMQIIFLTDNRLSRKRYEHIYLWWPHVNINWSYRKLFGYFWIGMVLGNCFGNLVMFSYNKTISSQMQTGSHIFHSNRWNVTFSFFPKQQLT